MSLLSRIASLWRNLSDKESLDHELTEELRAHVDLLTEKKIGEGLKPEEARRAALIEVGGIEQVKERVREVRTGRPLEDLAQDLRYALRGLRKHRGFTTVAVITLALGIGANTAIFTVINTVLLRPLPFERPDQLVVLMEIISNRPIGVSYPNFVDLRSQNTALENVANLLLTRSAGRQREMAIRTALGAGRARILRQLFTESAVLALAGGVVGLLLAIWGTSLISSYIPEGIPRMSELGIDGRVVLFTLAASLLTAVFFGLAPALQSSNTNLTETLKEGERNSSRGHNRAGKLLVISEVALTLVLLVGAGLLVKSFWRLNQADPGFDPQNVLAMQISISARPDEGPRVDGFLSELKSRVKTLPGVQSVSVSNGLPFEGANFPPFIIEGQPPASGQDPTGLLYTVSTDYFKTMGIDLVRGCLFSPQDNRQTPRVALIDEVFARQYFPNQDPIGHRFKLNTPGADTNEIIGVVRHVEHVGLEGQTANTAEFYFNFDQIPIETLPRYVQRVNLLVRTTVEPLSLAGPVTNQISALDKDQAVFNVRTMEQALARSVAARRFSMILLGVFAMLALTLAAVGIYGVISYSVAQRTREVGIRMALGAKTIDVIKLVVRDGLKLVMSGIGVGLVGALLLTRMMTTLLFGVTPTDVVTYATVALGLIVVALIACCIPARRATKVDPLVALRFE